MIGLVLDAVAQALAQLRAHRDRALLTLFGITWGTAAMVALVSWGGGMRNMVGRDMRKIGENLMYVWPQSVKLHERNAVELRRLEVTLDDLDHLDRTVPEAADVFPELPLWGSTTRYGTRTVSEMVMGTVPRAEKLRKFKVSVGRFINEEDMRQRRRVCLLGAETERRLFQGANPVGGRVTIAGVPFRVVGRLATKGNQMLNMNGPDDDKILIPATTGRALFGSMRYANQFVARLHAPNTGDAAAASIRRYLAEEHNFDAADEAALNVFDTSTIVRLADFSLGSVRIFVGLVGAGTLLIAGLGVMNIMLVSVRERTPEVGLRLAIGGRRIDIFLQFLTESLVVTALGGLIGITLALLLCVGFGALDLPPQVPRPEISWGAVVAALITMMFVGVTAGTWPAYQASRLDPVHALRYE